MGNKKKPKAVAAEYCIDPKLNALLERGYAAREAGKEMTRRIEKVVDQLNKKFPGQNKMLRSVLDGQRQKLMAEQEKRSARQ